MDKILITGVAGFIGSNLAEYLVNNDNTIVYGIDNFSSSTMSNLYPLLKHDNFEFIEYDLTAELQLSADYICHCAGCGDFRNYYDDKYQFIINEFDALKNLIKYTQERNARLTVLSGYFDYCDSYREFYQFYDYAILKESLLSDLINNDKINAKIVRLGEVYGKNMLKNDGRFISKTIINALENKNIEITNKSLMSYQYIDDVIKALVQISQNKSKTPIFNLKTSNLHSQNHVADLIIKLVSSESQIDDISNDVKNDYYTTYQSKENEILCSTALEDGLKNMIDYFKLMYFS